MKLRQGQTWKLDQQYFRIALLERLAVEYKTMSDLNTKQGTRQRVTKKEFCRLIKSAVLLSAQEVAASRDINSELLSKSEIEANTPQENAKAPPPLQSHQ
ncbi:MAG: hypothetical protein ABIP71_13805 [Verrucomicrobiota bacterium]